MTIQILGAKLRGHQPDQACLALRSPAFREAMQHGIDPAARWAFVMAVVRPLAALRERVLAGAARGELRAIAAEPMLRRLDPIGLASQSRAFASAVRHRPWFAVAALAVLSLRESAAEDQHETDAEDRARLELARTKLARIVWAALGLIR